MAADLNDEMSEMVKYLVSLGVSPEEPLARRIDPSSCDHMCTVINHGYVYDEYGCSVDHIKTIADVWAGPPIYCSSVQLRRLLRRASWLLQEWTEVSTKPLLTCCIRPNVPTWPLQEYLTEQLQMLVEVAGNPSTCISRVS